MTISESLYFVYDGKKSSDFGILNVNKGEGMQSSIFLPEARINEIKIKGNDRPYHNGVEYSPITIKHRFFFEEPWNEELIRKVARWLFQPYYKELYFSDNISRRFYAMYTGTPQLLDNTLKQGYMDLEMRNIDCFTYSPVYKSNVYDLSSNSGTTIELDNKGDVEIYPIIKIQKVGFGSVSIKNNSNGGEEFLVSNLNDGEELIINGEEEDIETNASVLRYDDHNDVFLKLVSYKKNSLYITGNCKLQFEYQFKTLQG